jgi:hypothetical protein
MTRRCALFLSLSFAACADAPDADPDGLMAVTVAAVGEHGVDSRIEFITMREEQAMRRARMEQSEATGPHFDVSSVALTNQATCDSVAAMWLYDGPSQTGHKLCLTRTGSGPLEVDALNTWIRGFNKNGGPLYWNGAVRSIWAGRDPAYLRRGASMYDSDGLKPFEYVDSAGSTIAGATVVGMHGNEPANRAAMTIRTSFSYPGCPQSFRVLLNAVDGSETIDTTCTLGNHVGNFCQCNAAVRVRYGEYYKIRAFPPSGETRPCSFNVHDAGLLTSTDPSTQPDTYALNGNSGLVDTDLCVTF